MTVDTFVQFKEIITQNVTQTNQASAHSFLRCKRNSKDKKKCKIKRIKGRKHKYCCSYAHLFQRFFLSIVAKTTVCFMHENLKNVPAVTNNLLYCDVARTLIQHAKQRSILLLLLMAKVNDSFFCTSPFFCLYRRKYYFLNINNGERTRTTKGKNIEREWKRYDSDKERSGWNWHVLCAKNFICWNLNFTSFICGWVK